MPSSGNFLLNDGHRLFSVGVINRKEVESMSISDERFGKAQRIIDLYETRKYTQEDIAGKFGISVEIVRKVTQMYNYSHTRLKSRSDPDNLREGEKVNMCISSENLSFLDNVTFKDTE